MLGKVKQLLRGKEIGEREIEEIYQMIKGSGRYPARMPSHYLAIAIELIYRDLQDKKHGRKSEVHLYISPKPTKYALGRPSVTFAVLALDWPGLLNTCTGTLHAKGFNVTFCEAIIIEEHQQKLGLVFMEIEVADQSQFQYLLGLEEEIKKTLLVTAGAKVGKHRLLNTEIQRLQHYSLAFDELQELAKDVSETDYNGLLGEERGEIVRFFLARTPAYITERTPRDLAHQIFANFTFVKEVRQSGRICAWVGNIPTRGGELTAISAAGYEHDLSMGDCFRVIAEVAPGYQRKYDKAFIVGASDPKNSINVIRIEIVDAKGRSLQEGQQTELQQKLLAIKETMFCDRLSPGVEFIGRKICPILLEEERNIKLPQVYMHPHSRTNIKVVIVASGQDRGQAFKLVEEISRVPGLEAGMPDPISLVTTGLGENQTVQEIAVIDVWVDFEKFFGRAKGPYNDELILLRIEKALRRADPGGSRLRIFDKTGRQYRRARSERISGLVRKQGHDPEIARQIVARLGDKLVVSPMVPDQEVLDQVITGMLALETWRDSDRGQPVVVWRRADSGPAGRGTSYTVLAIAHSPKVSALPDLIKTASRYGLESSTVVDNSDAALVILRLSHLDKSLEENEIQELASALKALLG